MITNIISERKLDIISDFIARYGKIAITCHVSPDGDAMGSTLGLCHFLKGLGKQATVVIPDMPPRNLIFLPGMRDVVIYTQTAEKAEAVLKDAELIFALDFNALNRIDKLSVPFQEATAKKY